MALRRVGRRGDRRRRPDPKSLAGTALFASSTLPPDRVLEVVREAATAGGRVERAEAPFSGTAETGVELHVDGESPDQLCLSVTSRGRLVELCAFRAEVGRRSGATALTVGGLLRYRTSASKAMSLIGGQGSILGFSRYERFLRELAARLEEMDPGAAIELYAPRGAAAEPSG